jgi:cytochrome c oxidase assembly protein subunit 11
MFRLLSRQSINRALQGSKLQTSLYKSDVSLLPVAPLMNASLHPLYKAPVRLMSDIPNPDEKKEKSKSHKRTYDSSSYNKKRNRDLLYYFTALGITALGVSYLAVPLYAAFCQMIGVGGTVQRDQQVNELNNYMERTQHLGNDMPPLRPIEVSFEATVHPALDWSFVPCQKQITLRIGETALAFFRAKNNMSKPFIGVSTYNVIPPQAGLYFNKIQCFCFDEQRLRAGEEMDMPVFFFLDPAMADDWRMDEVDQVTLCYTFFPAVEDEVDTAMSGINTANAASTTPTLSNAPSEEAARQAIALISEKLKSAPKEGSSPNSTSSTSDPSTVCPPMPEAMHNPSKITFKLVK